MTHRAFILHMDDKKDILVFDFTTAASWYIFLFSLYSIQWQPHLIFSNGDIKGYVLDVFIHLFFFSLPTSAGSLQNYRTYNTEL
jgi:hypothetical protein